MEVSRARWSWKSSLGPDGLAQKAAAGFGFYSLSSGEAIKDFV